MKSLVILAIWLALSGAIYWRIALFFALNRSFLSAQWEWDSKRKQPIRFQSSIKVINKISGKWKAKSHCMENFATTITKTLLLLQVFFPKLCDFKTDVIKWQLNFVQFWSEIIRIILNRFWNHTDDFRSIKLHSTQFSYHYKSTSVLSRMLFSDCLRYSLSI